MVGLYGSFIRARKNKGQGHQTRSQITGRTNRWTSYIQKSESMTSFGKENPTATILELTKTAITSKSLKPEYMFIQNKKRQRITTNHTQTWPSLQEYLTFRSPSQSDEEERRTFQQLEYLHREIFEIFECFVFRWHGHWHGTIVCMHLWYPSLSYKFGSYYTNTNIWYNGVALNWDRGSLFHTGISQIFIFNLLTNFIANNLHNN